MYGKPSMLCFKYQLYLYGTKAIPRLNAIIWAVTEPAPWVVKHRQAAPIPTSGNPPLPHFVWQHCIHPFGSEL